MPTRQAVAEGLFDFDAEGRLTLLGGFSATSGLTHFPRGEVCPYSGASDVEPIDLPQTGRLWLWTAVTAAPPGYGGPIPYGFGIVELTNGLRVLGRLTVADPSLLREGQPMRTAVEVLSVADDGTETITWAFAPEVLP